MSVPIGGKNLVFKTWQKGDVVTQDDIKRDTEGTNVQQSSETTKVYLYLSCVRAELMLKRRDFQGARPITAKINCS